MSESGWIFDEGGRFPRCICCGGIMGEIEGGKVIETGRHRSPLLKNIDYVCICGDCLANAEEDDDKLLKELKGEAIA